jgi:hypothetical protein
MMKRACKHFLKRYYFYILGLILLLLMGLILLLLMGLLLLLIKLLMLVIEYLLLYLLLVKFSLMRHLKIILFLRKIIINLYILWGN